MKRILTFAILLAPFILGAAPREFDPSQKFRMMIGMLFFVLVTFCMKIGLLAFGLLFSVLRPQLVIRGSELAGRNILKSFLAGLMCAIFYMLLLAISKMIPRHFGLIIVMPVMLLLFLHLVVGFSMICNYIGEKVHANTGSRFAGSTFMAVLAGGVLAISLTLIPVFGEAAFLAILSISLGAALMLLFARKSPESAKN